MTAVAIDRSRGDREIDPARPTFRNVQALRAIAALLVVSLHVGNPLGFESHLSRHPHLGALANVGYFGVDLFFIISGFIMVVVTQGRGGLADARSFLYRRVVRIYPPVWIVEALVLVVYLADPRLIDSHSTIKPNLVDSFLLLPQAGEPLLLVTWTLVFEMYFYLVVAAALAAGRRRFFPTLAAWGGFTAVLALALPRTMNPWLGLVSNPLSLEFLLGMVVGVLVCGNRFARPWVAVGLGAVIEVASFAAPWHGSNGPNAGWIRFLEAIPLALIVYGCIGLERRDRVIFPKALDAVGDASYAIYLWHIPVLAVLELAIARFYPLPSAAEAAAVVAGYVAVVATGLAVYRFVERPLLVRLQSRDRKPPRPLT
jgi:exopolysaccharide production protein ExoZ